MYPYIKEFISRPTYYDRIEPFINTDIIKVIVGQRRVGKSYLLFEIMSKLLEKNSKVDIIYINKENLEFDAIKTYDDLYTYIKNNKSGNGKCYVFIDEIQDIVEWEKAVRSLFAVGGYDIYITGSNARLLSSELATYLSGRYIEFKVHGLSYPEFLEFHKLEESSAAFEKFYKYGGLPYLSNLQLNERLVYEYTKSTYNSIVLKDVVERHNIRNVRMLHDLTTYMADNIGTPFSATRISMFLKSQRIDLSPKVILEYLQCLESAFIIKRVKRTDIKGKKIFEINEKYFFEDLGIRNSIVALRKTDIARILENVVYQHLIYKGYEVYIGKLGEKEIDFVADRYGERVYIQVTYIMTEEKTIEREIGNLLEIKDNYPKLVVMMDESESATYKGIELIGIRRFLTKWENHESKETALVVSEPIEKFETNTDYFFERYQSQLDTLKTFHANE